MRVAVIEFLTSDPALVLWSTVGLMVTAASILRDTRTQRLQRTPLIARVQPGVKRREEIAR